MEITEIPATEYASCSSKYNWLRDAISDAEEKMRNILELWEENNSHLEKNEAYEGRKAAVTREVQDFCKSYCLLAEKYDRLKLKTLDSRSSTPLNYARSQGNDMKQGLLGSWDDSYLEAIDSNLESTTEDAENESNGTAHEFEHLKKIVHNFINKDDSIWPEIAWIDREKFRMSKLVEENTRLQVELIRGNNEKRETIKKLQDQVSRLLAENDALQIRLSCHDHVSSKRKSRLLDKFFRVCS